MSEPTLFRRKNLTIHILGVLLLIGYAASQYKNLSLDLWNDEIYTLKKFVLVPISQILTDYHVPNNHIFANLLNHLYLRLIDSFSMDIVLDDSLSLRLLQFTYSLAALIYVFKTGKKFFNNQVALLSIGILATTIPFTNFALEVRGYSLSTFFSAAVLFHCLNYSSKPKFFDLLLIFIFSALAVYTIPLNLYFLISVGLFYFIQTQVKSSGIEKKWTVKKLFQPADKHYRICLTLGAGVSLALLFYIPVISSVFSNTYVKSSAPFAIGGLTDAFNVLRYFASYRIFILALGLIGLTYVVSGRKSIDKPELQKLMLVTVALLTPFMLSFARGDNPPNRAFVNLAPFFALLLSIGISYTYSLVPKLRNFHTLITILLIIYSYFVFALEQKNISSHLLNDIKTSARSQDMYYDYYRFHFNPGKVTGEFYNNYYSKSSIVVLHDAEPHDMPDYLKRFGIRYLGNEALDSLLTSRKEEVFVITRYPNEFKEWMQNNYPDYQTTLINASVSYHNFIQCKVRSGLSISD